MYAGKADTITEFGDRVQIFLEGSYGYDAGGISAPGEGRYRIRRRVATSS